jgi:hypothetical protein
MYILVNSENIIVASSTNKPSEEDCSEKCLAIYKISKGEFSPLLIGKKLEDFDIVERE